MVFQGLFIFFRQVLTQKDFSAIIIMRKVFAPARGAMGANRHQTCHIVAERRIYGKAKLEGLVIHTARNRLSRSIFSLSLD